MTDWTKKSALNWDCTSQGCYNVNGRPKLRALSEGLPGKFAFGDIDATIEIGGRFLFVEWKSPGADLKQAQEIYHKNLTALSPRITSIVAEGDQAAMKCDRIRVFKRGRLGGWEKCSFPALQARIEKWVSAAATARKTAA